jgi:hypothetical protein
LRTFSLPYFSLGYVCYFGGSTTFGQIVPRPLATYNRDTLVSGFSEQVPGSWVAADVYFESDALEEAARDTPFFSCL